MFSRHHLCRVLAWSVSVLLGGLVPGVADQGLHAGLAAATQASMRWTPPLGEPLRISGPYRAPPGPYAAGHRGIDVPALPGATIRAPAAGTVVFVGAVVDRGVISIQIDADTVLSIEPIHPETALAVGDSVTRGDVIGKVATGGHCYDECVHLGVRVAGEYVHPGRFFFVQPVLLPW